MDFELDLNAFKSAVKLSLSFINTNSFVPILQCICFTGTEMISSRGIEMVQLCFSTPFKGIINGSDLQKALDFFSGDKIQGELRESSLVFFNDKTRVQVTLEQAAFTVPKKQGIPFLITREFVQLFRYCFFNLENNENVPERSGITIYFDRKNKQASLFSTNGYSIIRVTHSIECPDLTINLPRFVCERLLEINADQYQLFIENDQLVVKWGKDTFFCNLLKTDQLKYLEVVEQFYSKQAETTCQMVMISSELKTLFTKALQLGKEATFKLENNHKKLVIQGGTSKLKIKDSLISELTTPFTGVPKLKAILIGFKFCTHWGFHGKLVIFRLDTETTQVIYLINHQ